MDDPGNRWQHGLQGGVARRDGQQHGEQHGEFAAGQGYLHCCCMGEAGALAKPWPRIFGIAPDCAAHHCGAVMIDFSASRRGVGP